MTAVVRPIRWSALRSDEAQKLIRERAKDTKNVMIRGQHAKQRKRERSEIEPITTPVIYNVLLTGVVISDPVKNDEGEWEVIIEKRMRNSRDLAVVTIVFKGNDKIAVKTVMWRD